jgi:hypothetical protein
MLGRVLYSVHRVKDTRSGQQAVRIGLTRGPRSLTNIYPYLGPSLSFSQEGGGGGGGAGQAFYYIPSMSLGGQWGADNQSTNSVTDRYRQGHALIFAFLRISC